MAKLGGAGAKIGEQGLRPNGLTREHNDIFLDWLKNQRKKSARAERRGNGGKYRLALPSRIVGDEAERGSEGGRRRENEPDATERRRIEAERKNYSSQVGRKALVLSRRRASQLIQESRARKDCDGVIPGGPIIAATLKTAVGPTNTRGMGADVTGVGLAPAYNSKLRNANYAEGESYASREEKQRKEFLESKYARWLAYAAYLRDTIQKVELGATLENARASPPPSFKVASLRI